MNCDAGSSSLAVLVRCELYGELEWGNRDLMELQDIVQIFGLSQLTSSQAGMVGQQENGSPENVIVVVWECKW